MKLLTIGIPTYNRAIHLKKCLDSILSQALEYKNLIEILISDNCSTDETLNVIKEYSNTDINIRVVTHKTNLGMDGNFISIMKNANSNFIWQISDDDILIRDGLKKVVSTLLQNLDIGVLYVNNIWNENPTSILNNNYTEDLKIIEFAEAENYFKKVNYWVTFLSAHIINTQKIKEIDLDEFNGTNLALLSWTIRVPISSERNIVMETPILVCRVGGQGGYGFVDVFAIQFNKILSILSKEYKSDYFQKQINQKMIIHYFPNYILGKATRKFRLLYSYENENWRLKFLITYWNNPLFYLFVFPGLIVSSKMYSRWLKLLFKISGYVLLKKNPSNNNS